MSNLTDDQVVAALERLAATILKLTEAARPADVNAEARTLVYDVSVLRAQLARPEE